MGASASGFMMDAIRRHFGLRRLDLDERHYMTSAPDLVVHDRAHHFLFSTEHRREFTSPLFHWTLSDGRRFSGRPPIKTRKHTWRSPLVRCVSVRTEADHAAMLDELIAMIRRSIEQGADEMIETKKPATGLG